MVSHEREIPKFLVSRRYISVMITFIVLFSILFMVIYDPFSLAVWFLTRTTGNVCWNFLWFGIPVVGWPLSHLCLKDKCVKGAKNFVNDTIGQIWISYGIFAVVIALALIFIAPEHIGAITMALLGYGTAMTGMVLKNGCIMAGGFITGIGGVAAFLLLKTADATAIFAVASIVSLILPGIMMNRKKH